MKAFLLAAGAGTRLRPLTKYIPKCLVPISGRPLLEIWLDLFARSGVSEVLINTHHLAEKVQEFAESRSGAPKIHLAFEPELLGSAGTLRANWDFVEGEEDFLVCYADNLTDIGLGRLIDFHRVRRASLTMALFRSDRPSECGIVTLGERGRVLSFEEKPAVPRSRLANGGIYVMHSDIRKRLPEKQFADIGFDLLPHCLDGMYGLLCEGVLMDIGTPSRHGEAQELWLRRAVGHRPQEGTIQL